MRGRGWRAMTEVAMEAKGKKCEVDVYEED